MVTKIEKVDEFILTINGVIKKACLYEEGRGKISSKVQGFLRGVFDEKRQAEYLTYINGGNLKYDSNKGRFDKKSDRMVDFLETLKEELIAREAFKGSEDTSFDKLESDVQKNKLESERRKNVAESKYWGFSIELIESVREELKRFRQTQAELLKSIDNLRKELKESKVLK